MIYAGDLLTFVIRPTLRYLAGAEPRLHSVDAEKLVLGTYLVEGLVRGDARLKQVKGPAVSPWQIEPATLRDVQNRVHIQIAERLEVIRGEDWLPKDADYLATNLAYACAICRCKYWLIQEPLPNTVREMAQYWKKHYNTEQGSGVASTFVERFVVFSNGLWDVSV